MKAAKLLVSAAASAAVVGVTASQASAQFPALPPPPITAPPFPNATGIAPQPAPPAGSTIWSRLGLSQEQREFCRRNMCRTPFGQLMGRIRSPFTRLSGGLIPPFCPVTPSLAELQDPGVIGAAAKVKQDKAGAAQRIEAIKLLATVDCAYWPEAEEALIGALRTDRNECVRFEAALALGRGCCCTCKVIVALSHTVCCSDKDGGFMEKSARVRAAAAEALERCIESGCCAPELPAMVPTPVVPKTQDGPEGGTGDPMKEKDKEKDKDKDKDKKGTTTSARLVSVAHAKPGPDAREKPAGPMTFADYYQAVPRVPRDQVLSNAMRALDIGRQIGMGFTSEPNQGDHEAAGVPAPRESFSMTRNSANLWDAMTRRSPKKPAAVPTMMMGEAPISQVSATAPRPTMPTAPAVKPAAPVATRIEVPIEPPMKSPAPALTPVKASTPVTHPTAPKALDLPAPKLEARPIPVSATPAPEAKVIAAPKMEAKSIPVPATPAPEARVVPAPMMEARPIPVPVTPAPQAKVIPTPKMEAKPISVPTVPAPEARAIAKPATPGIAKVPVAVTAPPVAIPVVATSAPRPVTVQPPAAAPVVRPAQAVVPDDEMPAEPVPVNRGGFR